MSGWAPYAPLSHLSLSHTIYWISNSDSMTPYNPRASFFFDIIGHLSDGVGLPQLWFLLVTPTPVSPWADSLMTTDSFLLCLHENKAGWQPRDLMFFCSWCICIGQSTVTLGKCAVYGARFIHDFFFFFFLIRTEALSKHPHVSHLKCLWLVSC